MPFTKYWPSGWRNLPDTSTPIMAEALDGIDQGIIDAQAAAAAAQETANTALEAGGDGIFVVPGLVLNGADPAPTDDGPAIQAALEAVEDGTRGASLLVHGTAGTVCYINSTITMSKSGTILDFDVPVLLGPDGRFRPWGVIDELPYDNPSKPALTADAPEGSTVLHVTAVPAGWGAGDYVGIRGKRTASGSVPNSEIFHSYIAALDVGALTITLVDPLPKDFDALWDTSWSNKLTQITKVTQSKLTGSPDLGDVTINCASTAVFTVGDVVQVIDDTMTVSDNPMHKEVAVVAEIVSGTAMKLSHALYHSYDLGTDARVQKLLALEDAEIRNLRVTHRAQGTAGVHVIEVRYAYNCRVTGFAIEGGGDDGVSWSGHAIRFTDSLACSATRGTIANPSDVTAGRGYGVSYYGATLCWVDDLHIAGTRHSVLWFAGASGCDARNVISTDARISDYDWHGADCGRNRTTSCTAVGGTRTTGDSSGRSAWKWGNPAHQAGDNGNVATDCLVVNYAGAAIEALPACGDNVWQGVVMGAEVGVKVVPLPLDDEAVMAGLVVRDSEFYDVPQPFDVNGGGEGIVAGFRLQNTSWVRCGSWEIANAPDAILAGNTMVDPAIASGQYGLKATNCPNLRAVGNDLSGGRRGVYLSGCTNARVTDNTLYDMAETVTLEDHGGNGGFLFARNWGHPFVATRSDTGTGPSTGTVTL